MYNIHQHAHYSQGVGFIAKAKPRKISMLWARRHTFPDVQAIAVKTLVTFLKYDTCKTYDKYARVRLMVLIF